MLRENNMDCRLIQNFKEEKNVYSGIKVICGITGPAHIRSGSSAHCLINRLELVVLGPDTEHFVRCGKETVLCEVYYSGGMLSSLFPGWRRRLRLREGGMRVISGEKPARIMKEIISECINDERESECMKRSLLYRLLDCLAGECFPARGNGDSTARDEADVRLEMMYQYIEQNYRGNISLSVLADKLFTSSSTLSRLFKKKTGKYFAEYVNILRMEYAVRELAFSEDSITRIAVDSGFSNLSAFNRTFREMYGMSPSEYRKSQKKSQVNESGASGKLVLRLREQLSSEMETDVVCISADTHMKGRCRKFWNQLINVGSMNTLLMANTQYHVVYLAENLGFRYARVWNLFSAQMKVTDGVHVENCSYDQMDVVLDFLDSHGILPFLDFGVRPSAAVKNEEVSVFYSEECIEFETRGAWEAMVSDFLVHVIKRYGKQKVEKWIFEFSYDVVHNSRCYKEEGYDFFNAYRYLCGEVRRLLPGALIGGPMAIVNYSGGFMHDFLRKSRECGCVPDFISILLFPYITLSEGSGVSYSRTADDDFEIREIEKIREIMREENFSGKLFISEWNNTLSSRNYFNDSCYRASYFVSKIIDMWGMADMAGVWMASDWVSSYFDAGGIGNGGNGLLTKDTICKPAYYGLQFLNQLGDVLLTRVRNCLITETERKEYYILCTNYRSIDEYCLQTEDIAESPDVPSRIIDGQPQMELEITVQNVENGRYVIKKRCVNQKEGNFLWEWGKFNYDSSLSSQDIKYIRQVSMPGISMMKVDVTDGKLVLRQKIEAQETILIHVYRI